LSDPIISKKQTMEDSNKFFSIFGNQNTKQNLDQITLRKPFFLKLLQPSWFKTIIAVLLTIGMTSGLNYLYKYYLKPILEYTSKEKQKNEIIDKQKEKIEILENETKNLKNLVENLSKNFEKMDNKLVETIQKSCEKPVQNDSFKLEVKRKRKIHKFSWQRLKD
jgi:esterase/lipase